MIRWVDTWNLKTSWTQGMYIYEGSWKCWLTMQFSVEIGLYVLYCSNNKRFGEFAPKSKDYHAVYIVTNPIQ